MDKGRIVQLGTPIEILERPADDFVGDFVGRQGIGLKNVRDRLAYIYQDQAILRLSALEPVGTRVTVTLPEFAGVRA